MYFLCLWALMTRFHAVTAVWSESSFCVKAAESPASKIGFRKWRRAGVPFVGKVFFVFIRAQKKRALCGYESSSQNANNSNNAWKLDFSDGNVNNNNNKNNNNYVLVVRDFTQRQKRLFYFFRQSLRFFFINT